jgi:hypothetical protein
MFLGSRCTSLRLLREIRLAFLGFRVLVRLCVVAFEGGDFRLRVVQDEPCR